MQTQSQFKINSANKKLITNIEKHQLFFSKLNECLDTKEFRRVFLPTAVEQKCQILCPVDKRLGDFTVQTTLASMRSCYPSVLAITLFILSGIWLHCITVTTQGQRLSVVSELSEISSHPTLLRKDILQKTIVGCPYVMRILGKTICLRTQFD